MTAVGAATPPVHQNATPSSRRGDYLLIGIALLLYLPFSFLGYGSDNDAYGVLDSGRILLQEHRYEPSRPPGYLLYEMSIGLLSRVGGSVLCNATSVAMALITLICLLRICEHFATPHRYWVAAMLMVHPVFWVNATSTMDYAWSLALLMAGLLMLLRRMHLLAGILLGLAIGTRLASFVAIFVFLLYALLAQPRDRVRVAAAGLIIAVIALPCYIPSFIWAGHTLGFLHPNIGGGLWSLKGYIARFVYKNLYLWGLPGALALCVILPFILARHRVAFDRRWRQPLGLSLAVVAGYELLFLRYPIELGYLLPIVPFVLILLAIGLRDRFPLLLAFSAALVSYALVNINLARPNLPNQASDAQFGLWIEPGYLVEDVSERWVLRDARSQADYGLKHPHVTAHAAGN